MSNLYISATVEGEEFFYEGTNEWKFLPEVAVQWFNKALQDLNAVIEKEAAKGTGSLKATLVMQWDDQEPVVAVYDNISYKDVTKVQRKFLEKYRELVEIAEKRNK